MGQNLNRFLFLVGKATQRECYSFARVRRETFLFRLVANLEAYMEGRHAEPVYHHLPFEELARWWRERWLLPRASRVDDWRKWRKEEIKDLLLCGR